MYEALLRKLEVAPLNYYYQSKEQKRYYFISVPPCQTNGYKTAILHLKLLLIKKFCKAFNQFIPV